MVFFFRFFSLNNSNNFARRRRRNDDDNNAFRGGLPSERCVWRGGGFDIIITKEPPRGRRRHRES